MAATPISSKPSSRWSNAAPSGRQSVSLLVKRRMPRLDKATAAKLYHEQLARKKSVDAGLERNLAPGWLLRYLVDLDDLLHGRWAYWAQCQMARELPAEPIPHLQFCDSRGGADASRKMLEKALASITG